MQWAMDLMQNLGYPGIILIVALENIFPPIPSEVILPFAGFLVARGSLSLAGVVIAATLGSMLGALVLYSAGWLIGRERIYRLTCFRYSPVSEASLRRAGVWFFRYGPWTVFFCRMVPTLRSLISIPAGLARMRLLTFITYTFAGTFLWNTVLVGLGAALGTAWPKVAKCFDFYDYIVIIGAVLAIGIFLWFRLHKKVCLWVRR